MSRRRFVRRRLVRRRFVARRLFVTETFCSGDVLSRDALSRRRFVWAPYRKCFSNPDVTVAAQNLILWESEMSNLLGIQSCCPIVQIGFQQGFFF